MLSIKHINKIIREVYIEEQENIIFKTWQGMYPFMTSGLMEFVSFNDFKEKLYSKEHKYTNVSNEEIEEEISEVFNL